MSFIDIKSIIVWTRKDVIQIKIIYFASLRTELHHHKLLTIKISHLNHDEVTPGTNVANVMYPVCPDVCAGGISVRNLHCSFLIGTSLPLAASFSSSAKSKDVIERYWMEFERCKTSCVFSNTNSPDLFRASTVFWTCSMQGENVHNLPPVKRKG